ncbi:hypothetical protein [Arthrobacter crusticola]|uniref:hypothetical protein n=1 Tax=Arthrobacter crusticola TaxID=2547960 RepID=UPI0014055A33|nr:hypothetical protein [Arthrobacter crusticola]
MDDTAIKPARRLWLAEWAKEEEFWKDFAKRVVANLTKSRRRPAAAPSLQEGILRN